LPAKNLGGRLAGQFLANALQMAPHMVKLRDGPKSRRLSRPHRQGRRSIRRHSLVPSGRMAQ